MSRLAAFIAVALFTPLALAKPVTSLNVPPPVHAPPTPSSFPPARLTGYYVVEDHPTSLDKARPVPPEPATTSGAGNGAANNNGGNSSGVNNSAGNNGGGNAMVKNDGAQPVVLGTDWRYYQENDGTIWRARRKSGSTFKLWGTGLALIGVSFAFSAAAGGYEPIVGGFVGAYNYAGIPELEAGLIIDGLIGVTGAILVITGAVYGKGGIEKEQIHLTQTAYLGSGDRGGLALHF